MRTLTKVLLAAAVLAIAAVTFMALEGHRRFTRPGPLPEATTMVIPRGLGLQAIARRLAEARVVPDPYSFMVGARLAKANLKAGEYAFPAHVSPREALEMMAAGKTVIHKLTVAEGLTSKQIMELVRDADYLAGDLSRTPAEGSLLPSTWHLSRDDSRDEVIARMEKSMRQTMDQLWPERAPGLPLKSKEEALVLASIVERETGVKAERPQVAAVFINRLKLGMRLQSDPTVIYGLSDGMGVLARPISRADLETAHRWNTYVIDGLPPTAIANPGRASIEAVLHPAETDALYFVADGSGGHVFAKSLDEHNRNVANWRKVEKTRREAK
jgi:UPF0755 protein